MNTTPIDNYNPAHGFKLLGIVSWFEIPTGLRDYDSVLINLAACDLPESMMPRRVSEARSFVRALRTIEREEKNHLLRRVHVENKDLAVFVLLREEEDETGLTVRFETENQIILNKRESRVEFRGDFRNTEIEELIESLQEKLNEQDLRAMVTRAIHFYRGTLVRQHGGVYFTPETYRDNLLQLREFVGLLGGKLYLADITDSEGTQLSIFENFKTRCVNELDVLDRELEKLEENEGGKRAWRNKLADVVVLLDRMRFYDSHIGSGSLADVQMRARGLHSKILAQMPGYEHDKFQSRVRVLDIGD